MEVQTELVDHLIHMLVESRVGSDNLRRENEQLKDKNLKLAAQTHLLVSALVRALMVREDKLAGVPCAGDGTPKETAEAFIVALDEAVSNMLPKPENVEYLRTIIRQTGDTWQKQSK